MENAAELSRLHDEALFRRAFPRAATDIEESERTLGTFGDRVARLEAAGEDLSPLDAFETSGIAGTAIAMDFSWGLARWLSRRHAGSVSLSWEGEPAEARLAATLPRLVPFLAERALADNGTDFRAWLEAALPRGTADGGLRWLVDRFEELPWDDDERAESWDALGFLVRWELKEAPVSRTLARIPGGTPFVSDAPLVPRRDVSIAREMEGPPPRVVPLSRAEGESFLDAARAAIAVRYREIHAFTWGNPADVVRADLGRGLSILCCGLLPDHRLPLRAGYGALLVRNGVPIGYVDAYALGDRLDLAFNVFYSFRNGESAWSYARTVAFFRAFLGTRTLVVDPYQFGRHNEEAIASGAFWFYRKLGFHPVEPPLEKLARREEARAAKAPTYRTPPATLRRLAQAPIAFDGPGAMGGEWDPFRLDLVGQEFLGRLSRGASSPVRAFDRARRRVARAIGLDLSTLPGRVACAFDGLVPPLDLALAQAGPRWTAADSALARRLVRAKAGRSEAPYVRAFARHGRLRENLLRAGTAAPRQEEEA